MKEALVLDFTFDTVFHPHLHAEVRATSRKEAERPPPPQVLQQFCWLSASCSYHQLLLNLFSYIKLSLNDSLYFSEVPTSIPFKVQSFLKFPDLIKDISRIF